jgi:hypothetical protein
VRTRRQRHFDPGRARRGAKAGGGTSHAPSPTDDPSCGRARRPGSYGALPGRPSPGNRARGVGATASAAPAARSTARPPSGRPCWAVPRGTPAGAPARAAGSRSRHRRRGGCRGEGDGAATEGGEARLDEGRLAGGLRCFSGVGTNVSWIRSQPPARVRKVARVRRSEGSRGGRSVRARRRPDWFLPLELGFVVDLAPRRAMRHLCNWHSQSACSVNCA